MPEPKLVATVTPDFVDAPPEPRTRQFERFLLRDIDHAVHPRVKAAVAAAQNWLEARKRGNKRASLVLVASEDRGDATGFGCGKTHIAKACLHTDCYWVDDAPVAPVGKFYLATDVMDELGTGVPLTNVAATGTIIVIDDVGTEETLAYVAAAAQDTERQHRYFRIVNHAYENHISVIITGNLTLGQLKAHIGGRAWSRLQQMAPPGCIVDLTGVPDYRLRLRR